jgi:hypothetical protein
MNTETSEMIVENEERTFNIDGTKIKESELSQEQMYLMRLVDRLKSETFNISMSLDEKQFALETAMKRLGATVKKEEAESS